MMILMVILNKVFNIELVKDEENVDSELESYIEDAIERRNKAKKAKDYDEADAIREELLSKGIKLIDTREGTSYEII